MNCNARTATGQSRIAAPIHAGMVVVADGTKDAARRLKRVLTTDPGTGVMRPAGTGKEEAVDYLSETPNRKVSTPPEANASTAQRTVCNSIRPGAVKTAHR